MLEPENAETKELSRELEMTLDLDRRRRRGERRIGAMVKLQMIQW